jgi:hypothetical protein
MVSVSPPEEAASATVCHEEVAAGSWRPFAFCAEIPALFRA